MSVVRTCELRQLPGQEVRCTSLPTSVSGRITIIIVYRCSLACCEPIWPSGKALGS